MEDNMTPAQALATANATRGRLADRRLSPWWYAPLYGLGCGGVVASFALPGNLMIAGTTVSLLFIVLLYSIWRSKTGIGVNGYRPGRTLPVTLALLAVMLPLLLVSAYFGLERGLPLASLACGLLAAIAAGFASHVWDRTWLAEMRKGL